MNKDRLEAMKLIASTFSNLTVDFIKHIITGRAKT